MRAKSNAMDPSSASDQKEKARPCTGSDLAKVDAHVITHEEYEDGPELTQEWFETADLVRAGEVVRRGRSPKESPKVAVSIRLSADVLEAFKKKGGGLADTH
ncbi:MAG: hypothetical protein JWL62_3510 [Hyphomicrobiales bacterium]|nr:hypothetical protein [Hyphomicrobiales bacterium]